MTNILKKNKACLVIFLLSFILAAAAYPFLEESIPIPWNASGEIDGYGNKLWVFMEPAFILLLTILMEITRTVDPKRSSYNKFEGSYGGLKIAIALLLLAVQILTIAVCFGAKVQIATVLPLLVGILFCYIGNMMPKIKHNYFVGIKTPWTLNDPEVWFRTHRFAGKIWFVGGIFIAFTAFLPGSAKFAAILGAAIVLAIVPMIYSYLISKKEKDS